MTAARCLAFAKLNLSLAVLGRRPDGYHEIDSLIQTVDLADRLDISVRGGRGIVVDNSLRTIQGPDLALRAAAALLAAKDVERHVEIRIEKGIPAGAGLGGGSSDAAAVLAALDRLTPPCLSGSALAQIAGTIGSDVPLFLVGGRLRVSGRGEIVTPERAVRDEAYAMVVPPVHCPTPDVYAAWTTHRLPRTSSGLGRNDLLGPALHLHPELRPVSDAVLQCGAAYAGMSGSGAAFYAAFPSKSEAVTAARHLADALPSCTVHVSCPTSRGAREIEGTQT